MAWRVAARPRLTSPSQFRILGQVKIVILHNPTAGRKRGRHRLAETLEVLRRAGVEPQVRESRDAQHLLELARQAREEKPDVVVSAGGDGTHHFVLNGLARGDVPLGLLSLGTGNDLAQGLGIPVDPRGAAETLLRGESRAIDLARVGSRYYGCMAGVGFDTTVTRYANERVRWLRGPLAYKWALLRCLVPYRPQALHLQSDAQGFEGKIMFAVVGNSVAYGGGLKMTPRARLDDGLLDVCIVPEMGKLELLRWVPRAYHGGHLAHPRILYFQARTIKLQSPARLEIFADGEFIQELPATIEVAPRALRIIAPRTARTD